MFSSPHPMKLSLMPILTFQMSSTPTPPQPTPKPSLQRSHHSTLPPAIVSENPHLTEAEKLAIFSDQKVTFFKCSDTIGADHLTMPPTPKPIITAFYGSSHIKWLENKLYTNPNHSLHSKHQIARVALEPELEVAQEIIDQKDNIHAVVVFLGGNDLDQDNIKGTIINQTAHHFHQIIQKFHYNQLPTFIFPVLKRTAPHHLTPSDYNALVYHLNAELQLISNKYNYPLLIQSSYSPTLSTDGIHLTRGDYVMVCHAIRKHIQNNVSKATFLLKVSRFTMKYSPSSLKAIEPFYHTSVTSTPTTTHSPTSTTTTTMAPSQNTTSHSHSSPTHNTSTTTTSVITTTTTTSSTESQNTSCNRAGEVRIDPDAWKQRMLWLSALHKTKVARARK